ncbi:MAG: hypothetical protein IPF54_02615 [Draconibacterium sp.]|nr:hypothetical protein [Draconibacterium sp.]
MSYLGNLKENKFISDSLVDLALIRNENYSQKIDNKYIEAIFHVNTTPLVSFKVQSMLW